MTAVAILTFGKIKSERQLLLAAKHNLRAIKCELEPGGHIDPERIHLNRHLAGPDTAVEVTRLAKNSIAAAGIQKLKKNAVRALEFLVTVPAGQAIDEDAYFKAALDWLAADFGGMQNVLSADVHKDEANPHMHVLILPLMDGRMIGSEALGGPARTARRYREFVADVAEPFGLFGGAERLSEKSRRVVAQAVLGELNRRDDPALRSSLFPPLRDDVARAPARYAAILGIDVAAMLPRPRLRSSTSIFISKGKGSQRREVAT